MCRVMSPQRWGHRLALAGTAVIWAVLLAPLASPLWVLIQRVFFVLGLVGAGMLFVASLLRHRYRALASVGLAGALVAVLLQRALMTDLGWIVSPGPDLATLVMAVYMIHVLSQVVLGVCGILLAREREGPLIRWLPRSSHSAPGSLLGGHHYGHIGYPDAGAGHRWSSACMAGPAAPPFGLLSLFARGRFRVD